MIAFTQHQQRYIYAGPERMIFFFMRYLLLKVQTCICGRQSFYLILSIFPSTAKHQKSPHHHQSLVISSVRSNIPNFFLTILSHIFLPLPISTLKVGATQSDLLVASPRTHTKKSRVTYSRLKSTVPLKVLPNMDYPYCHPTIYLCQCSFHRHLRQLELSTSLHICPHPYALHNKAKAVFSFVQNI